MNEVSTVAAAYAFAGYAVDATHVSSSGSAIAQTGISNAFASATNLAGISTGTALTTTPAGNGTVPQKTINTIANILTSCVNSTGPSSTPCATLFANAKSQGAYGTAPTDTATAAINIAHNPGNAVGTLFGLITGSPAFSPSLTSVPNDFTLAVTYSGVGGSGASNGAYSIAIDNLGDAWFVNVNNNSVSKFSANGAPLSPANGFAGANFFIPAGIAIDLNGNAWIVDSGLSNIVELSASGSPVGTFSGGGLATPQDIAIDGYGNVWAVNGASGSYSLSEFNSSGTALSPAGVGFIGGNINKPTSLAIDQAERIWVANQAPGTGSLSAFNNNGTPITITAAYTGGGLNNPQALAIDNQNNIWIANIGANSVSLFNQNGTAISPSTGFTGGGLNKPYTLAIDGAGNVWAANSGSSSISELNNAGSPMSPSTGYGFGLFAGPAGIDIDGAGNVWVANTNSSSANTSVIEVVGAAVPRVTPNAYGIKIGGLSTRP
jgi:streptogramin lyase